MKKEFIFNKLIKKMKYLASFPTRMVKAQTKQRPPKSDTVLIFPIYPRPSMDHPNHLLNNV